MVDASVIYRHAEET